LLIGLFAWSTGPLAAAAPESVVFADQTGPGHLVSVVIKRRNLLAEKFSATKFDWRIVTSGAVVRDGMMAGQIHVGIYAPPPFLIGWDKGLKWKIIAAAATYDQWLVVKDSKLQSLKDFKAGAPVQIGVAGIDSFPAIVVRKAAKKELGNSAALDTNLLVMPPPQAIQLVLSGQLGGALVPPVHSIRAVDGGARVILRGNDVFSGPVTNNFYVMTEKFYADHPDFARAFHGAVVAAIRFIAQNPDEAYRLLAEDQGGNIKAQQYRDWIVRSGTEFDATPVRVLEVAEFMKEIKMIKQAPRSMEEISFPEALGPKR
jgi:NitT/TauT family transport system substrate-binding protein